MYNRTLISHDEELTEWFTNNHLTKLAKVNVNLKKSYPKTQFFLGGSFASSDIAGTCSDIWRAGFVKFAVNNNIFQIYLKVADIKF